MSVRYVGVWVQEDMMHRRFAPLLAMFLIATSLAFAQPVLSSGSPAVNSASYRIPGSSGAGVAQGSMFAVFGRGLGPSVVASATQFPLTTSLRGTSVTVTVGGVSAAALILFTYQTQVNAVLPSTTPVGNGTITVTYNGQTSAPAPIQVVASAFGFYTFDSSGWGQAIALNLSGQQNTIIQTFHPGDWGSLWGTGLGAIASSDAVAPPVGDLPGEIRVYVGNTAATVNYHGRAGCCSGLDQINFQIPAGVQGCHVPIAVQAGGTLSNVATIAVSASGQTCSDSVMGQDLVNKLASGQNATFGYVRLENLNAPFDPSQAYRANMDFGFATFSRYTPQTAGLAEYGVSSGYCVAVDSSNWRSVRGYPTLVDSSLAQLDTGLALTLQGQGTMPISQTYLAGYYFGQLNATVPRFLWSGLSYSVSGAGGKDIGAFSATETTSIPSVDFTNIGRSQSLSRSADLVVQWSGGDPGMQNGQVTIGGYSYRNSNADNWAMFQCTAPLSAKTLTIPGWILAALPPSGTGQNGTLTYPLGWIWIGQYSNPVTFQAPGLDRGIYTDVFFNGVGVYFQ